MRSAPPPTQATSPTANARTSARKVGTCGLAACRTSESATALYGWPPAGSTPLRAPRADMEAARVALSTPFTEETFTAAFSNNAPPANTRVRPVEAAPPAPSRVQASVINDSPLPSRAA